MHQENVTGKRFFAVTILNITITVVELIGGVLSGSLALLSDAFHNFGDSASIIVSYFAQVVGNRPETSKQTYGYKRAEILSALLNALLLVIIAIGLLVEAVKRFQHPTHINGEIMLIVAVVGLIANFLSAALLHAGSHDSLNIKATYLHVLSDALSSLAVIIAAIILIFVNIPWLDPLLTVAVALYIAWEALPILKQTLQILMQAAPKLDYHGICQDIQKIDGVVGVHHIHAWSVDEHHIMFSLHINCPDIKLSEAEKIYSHIEHLLRTKYGICHITIQAECDRGRQEPMFDTMDDEKHGI